MVFEKQKINHMGEIVRKAMEKRNMSASDLAQAINCSRPNVYSIFNRQQIDMNRLNQIISVLKLKLSDFIETQEEKSSKCIALIEIEEKMVEKLAEENHLELIKAWKTR